MEIATDTMERALLDGFQRDLPLVPRPFAEIAHQLGTDEATVIGMLRRLSEDGVVSRVGPVLAPHRVGCSTLAAMAVPEERLDEVADLVSSYDEVNHNYEREHRFNLWFVLNAADREAIDAVLHEIAARTGLEVVDLPLLEAFSAGPGVSVAMALSEADRRLIAAVQDGLPLVARPYAEVGAQLGLSEDQVIAAIGRFLRDGVIKRLGIVVRHHELGYRSNAMVVWDVRDAEVGAVGRRLAKLPFVTLCYRRPRRLPDWPYNLFCMIHGRDRASVEAQIEHANQAIGLSDLASAVLFSGRRFKQRGARYASRRLEVA